MSMHTDLLNHREQVSCVGCKGARAPSNHLHSSRSGKVPSSSLTRTAPLISIRCEGSGFAGVPSYVRTFTFRFQSPVGEFTLFDANAPSCVEAPWLESSSMLFVGVYAEAGPGDVEF
eukprot:GHVU01117815.1.p1 GENE.GHVU01117815.1~~GHVU01117815.1.p1  ORF type:complete len:117 (+),score=2.73 GHVU01117815.1:387-737(+)